jgi:hypothetical protein
MTQVREFAPLDAILAFPAPAPHVTQRVRDRFDRGLSYTAPTATHLMPVVAGAAEKSVSGRSEECVCCATRRERQMTKDERAIRDFVDSWLAATQAGDLEARATAAFRNRRASLSARSDEPVRSVTRRRSWVRPSRDIRPVYDRESRAALAIYQHVDARSGRSASLSSPR